MILRLIFIFFTVSLLGFEGERKESFKYKLALAAIFKNESAYLKEWIEFHHLVGVEHFFLYNNFSTDEYLEVLKPYVQAKLVEVIDWNETPTPEKSWNKIQIAAYRDAIERSSSQALWVAFLDTDEFLFSTTEDSLPHFLKDFSDPTIGGIVVNWQMYGTSHVARIPPGFLLIEALTLKGPAEYCENQHVKSIVNPRAVQDLGNPHNFIFKAGYHQVNAHHEVTEGPYNLPILVEPLRINHYWSRDEEFFITRKIERRSAWGDAEEVAWRRIAALNEVEDKAIFRFIPELKKRLLSPLPQ